MCVHHISVLRAIQCLLLKYTFRPIYMKMASSVQPECAVRVYKEKVIKEHDDVKWKDH